MHFAAFFSCSHLAAGLVSTQVVSSLTALFLSRLNSVYLGVNYLPVTYTRLTQSVFKKKKALSFSSLYHFFVGTSRGFYIRLGTVFQPTNQV